MDDPVAWFTNTIQLPGTAMLPAVAAPLARMDADEAAALWEAWREYAPGVYAVERAAQFAAVLRRGVETAVCTVYPEVAWVAVGEDEPEGVPESAWELLLNDTPLTASVIRLLVHAGDVPVIVHLIQRRGERVPKDERGPFRLP
ncbi:MAG: hypothetical protein M3176_02575 [Chloroflexota bacterium]|nr:hypothetical protein [Chloroflexota bacterium]